MAEQKRGAHDVIDDGNVCKSDKTPERSQTEAINKKSIEQWLIEVKNVDQDPEAAGKERLSTCIFTVPMTLKGLKGKKAAAIYMPQIVSCGPFHFHEHEDASSMGKSVKSAIIRSIRTKLGIHGESFISAIVQKIKKDEQSIRGCYDREIKFDSDVLSWMMARDAIFILQFLRQRLLVPELRFLRQSPSQHARLSVKEEITTFLIKGYDQRFTGEIDSIPLADTLKDLIKLENQIPLFVIRSILGMEREMNIMELKEESTTGKARQKPEVKWTSAETGDRVDKSATVSVDVELRYILESTCRFLSPIVKVDPTLPNNWNEKSKHILEGLRYYVVSGVFKQQGSRDQAIAAFAFQFVRHAIKRLFQCFLYVFTFPFISRTENGENTILKCAVELERAGVKFSPLEGGIEGIHFDERISTLYLPKVEVDPHTETIMRNMMAFELCYLMDDNAVTRYAHFMDQLIDTEKDVAVLRQSGVIHNKLGSDSKVADFWNSLSDSTWTPDYRPIDAATENLKKYYLKRRTAVYAMWNEFREENCAKPWTFIALLVSLGLIIMTILEVNCAYQTCDA